MRIRHARQNNLIHPQYKTNEVYIYLLCYNEESIISQTIEHYKRCFPSAVIIIYDNNSTDHSVEIAKSYGCQIETFESKDTQNVFILTKLKNECWKKIHQHGWVIVADMDEWLYVTQTDLDEMEKMNITMVKTQGYQMIGESVKDDLTDIQLASITKCVPHDNLSKYVCFYRSKIKEINYEPGAHRCNPVGIINYSKKVYPLKHYKYLGLPYLLRRIPLQYQRTLHIRQLYNNKFSNHYTDSTIIITEKYNKLLSSVLL